VQRVDLISSKQSEAFYESLAHRTRVGFRIYTAYEGEVS